MYEFLTIENVSTWAFAIFTIISAVVWLWCKEWLAKAMKLFISVVIPLLSFSKMKSVASDV
jgi:hypothetical protein